MKTKSKQFRNVRLTVLFLFIGMIIIMNVSVINTQWNSLINTKSVRAITIANLIDLVLKKSEYTDIMKSDIPNEYYCEFKNYINSIEESTEIAGITIADMHEGNFFKYFLEGSHNIGKVKQRTVELGEHRNIELFHPYMAEVFKTAQDITTPVYSDANKGMLVSGYSPIVDAKGMVLGVIAVDISVDPIVSSIKLLIIISIWLTIFIAAVSWFTLRYYESYIYNSQIPYHNILDSIKFSIITTDKTWNINFANKHAIKKMGGVESDVIGKNYSKCYIPYIGTRFCSVEDLIKNRNTIEDINGIKIARTINYILGNNGDIVGYVHTLRNITNLED